MIYDNTFNDEFYLDGSWFVPDVEEKKINGSLKYIPHQKIILKLIGSFSTIQPHFIKYIYGYVENGSKVTLINCSLRRQQYTGVGVCEWEVEYIISGNYFNDESLVFDKFSLEIDGLSEWLDISGFTILSEFSQDEIILRHQKPKPIRFNISKEVKCELKFSTRYPYEIKDELKIKQFVSFKVIAVSEPITFDFIIGFLKKIESFISFVRYKKSTTTGLWAEPVSDNDSDFSSYIFFINDDSSTNRRYKALFPYDLFKDKLGNTIERWFDLNSSLPEVIEVVCNNIDDTRKHTINEFLDFARSLEAYHTKNFNRARVDKKEYDDMITKVKESLPEDIYTFFKSKFDYGNTLSLHERLEELLRLVDFGSIKDVVLDNESFIKQVKHSRNHYTHLNDNKKKHILTGKELILATDKIKVIIITLIILDLGLDKKIVDEISQEYKWFFPFLYQQMFKKNKAKM